jgi:hypothetical protein
MLMAVRVEAMRRARAEVKAAIQREGRIKLSQVPPREITAQAEAYVLSHRELIAEARARVEQWRVEGFFGKTAQNLQHLSNSRRPAAYGLPLNECHAQNGAAK